jgi:quercetin dioxygenase-like cupin family protein
MRAGQRGPEHSFDVEQIWHLLAGSANVVVETERFELSAGDTIVLAAHSSRQVSTEAGATFIVTGNADALATPLAVEGAEPVTPAWIV